ncbi:MAG TPA: NrfD/PsrC family molybdoenzyme membrane anchor subunit [Candidatus Dormibacteraeota bacterium]
MVPDATFTSYYGRPVVKASPWKNDIPAYFFLGGLAAGSSLLAAGADITGRQELRRAMRICALVSVTAGTAALIHDLGKPSRFLNMLRVAKPTSPMSVGTWILTAFGPMVGIAASAEVAAVLPRPLQALARPVTVAARPAGLLAAALAPGLASYTGVLLGDTATPAWHAAHRELPFVFAGSAAMAAGGLGMMGTSVAQAGPARRLAIGGVLLDVLAERRMEGSMGISAETLRVGRARLLMRTSRALAAGGLAGTIALGRRSRLVSLLSGGALVAASACTRFAIFEAGQTSARDPRYTVAPQRERIDTRIGQ